MTDFHDSVPFVKLCIVYETGELFSVAQRFRLLCRFSCASSQSVVCKYLGQTNLVRRGLGLCGMNFRLVNITLGPCRFGYWQLVGTF